MKVITLIVLFIELTAAQISRLSCSYNELCIEITSCPKYRNYAQVNFKKWPAELRSQARDNLCSVEMVNGTRVLSVCCPTVLNDKKCGIQGGFRISKGKVAKPFEFPWMTLLRDNTNKFVCGGTLISARYVLTAAHCILRGTIVSVRLGENDINQDEDCIEQDGERDCAPPPQDIAIQDVIKHSYSNRYKTNDIALLKLQKAATLNAGVGPICLPDGTPGQRMLEPSTYIVSGWGLTENGTMFDVLRYALVPPVSLERCQVRVLNLISAVQLDRSHFCAGGIDQIDNCSGDSGGPLKYVSNATSRFFQQGVVSFGIRSCGKESEPGVYTNVAHFISWIFEHVDE